MKFCKRTLYPKRRALPRPPLSLLIGGVLCFAIAPFAVNGTDPLVPYEQEYVLTAYYSPLPRQCCYIKGGYVADKILNGEGVQAADGTPVYPGMLAAPGAYAFGTVVDLPGLGIMTVHDRGGAIQVLEDGKHRLDVWVGYGEEGLARALAFGVKRIKGTVYPVGSATPTVGFDLANLPAPPARLEPYAVNGTNLLAVQTARGESGLSVVNLQNSLRGLGYLQAGVTGVFDDPTVDALGRFMADHTVPGSSEQLTEETAARLLAAVRRTAAPEPVTAFVDDDSAPQTVTDAQRTLRLLGYYRGRTDGVYDEDLQAAILRFQQANGLVGTAEDPGAGRIGPITMRRLNALWNKELVARRADRYLDMHRIDELMTARGGYIDRFLEEGMSGPMVLRLQEILVDRGYFDAEEVNGSFGPLTKEAVIDYQLATGIITSASAESAGYVGVATVRQLRLEERAKHLAQVRADGWSVL